MKYLSILLCSLLLAGCAREPAAEAEVFAPLPEHAETETTVVAFLRKQSLMIPCGR